MVCRGRVTGEATRPLTGAHDASHLQPPQSERQWAVVQQTKDRPRSLPPSPLLRTRAWPGDAVGAGPEIGCGPMWPDVLRLQGHTASSLHLHHLPLEW